MTRSQFDRRSILAGAAIAPVAVASAATSAAAQAGPGPLRPGGDDNGALVNAITATHRGAHSLTLGPGRFRVSQLNVPADISVEFRGVPFQLLGTGAGEAFVTEDAQAGTIIEGQDPSRSVVHIRTRGQRGARQGAGSIEWGRQRVTGRSSRGVPLLEIDGLAGLNHLHDFVLYQHGEGDGLRSDWMVTTTVERFFTMNRDWAGPAARHGVGFRLVPSGSYGLTYVANCTSRGWATGYEIGDGSGSKVLSSKLMMTESSVVGTGIRIGASVESLSIDTAYLEGIEETGIVDQGRATSIVNPYIVLGFGTGIELHGEGGHVVGGYIGLRPADATGVRIAGSPFGNSLFGTEIVWGAATVGGSNGTGLHIEAASDPLVFAMVGFNPAGEWPTGRKLLDESHSAAHGGAAGRHGSGVVGIVVRDSGAHQTIPCLARGAVNLHVDGRRLGAADIDGRGILSLSAASVQVLTLDRPLIVARLAAPNLPDKTGVLIVDNGNLTLRPGEQIRGLAAPLVLAAGEAAVIEYQILPGPNAPAMITNIHRIRRTPAMPSFAVAELAVVREGLAGPVLARDGRKAGEPRGGGTGCPVWFDGADWRTFHDNQVVSA